MKIENLSQLKKLLALCRQQGVNIIKVDGMELVLEGQPEVKVRAKATQVIAPGGITEETKVSVPDLIQTPDELTEEQLLYYSAGGNQ